MLVLLTDVGDGPEVLLTRRSWEMRSHRGEVSFPGGRMDPGETALRHGAAEAHEEVGLEPELVTVHGELASPQYRGHPQLHRPQGRHRDGAVRSRCADVEVERVLWVPLAEFTREGAYRSEQWGEPPLERMLHFFELDDETVWGATARIIADLLRRGPRLTQPVARRARTPRQCVARPSSIS